MKLDALDVEFLEHPGTPQETVHDLLGWELTKQSAKNNRTKIRKYLKYKQDKILEEREPGEMEQTVIKEDGSVTTTRMLNLSETESQDPATVMKLMGYDPLQWKLVWCKVKRGYWDVSMKVKTLVEYDTDGKPVYKDVPTKKTNHTYKCEISVKPIQDILSTEMLREIFSELTPPKLERYSYPVGNCVVEPAILDFHLGKGLSLQDEISLYKSTVLSMLGKLKNYNIVPKEFVVQVGQDFFHIDGSNKTTTFGTPMDVTVEWSEIYRLGAELKEWEIEQYRAIAPVKCFYVPGNHDKTLSFCLALQLERIYAKCPDVDVDTVDFPRKYYQYAINAIGMSHGRDEGKRIQHTMQQEAPQIWANTQRREFHLGDLHHEKSEEIGGVIYKRISALTILDQWHIDRAYKAIRKAPCHVWYKNGDKDELSIIATV